MITSHFNRENMNKADVHIANTVYIKSKQKKKTIAHFPKEKKLVLMQILQTQLLNNELNFFLMLFAKKLIQENFGN